MLLLEQTCPLNSDSQLVSHNLQDLDVVLMESCFLGALHVQSADNVPFHTQRQGHLRARARQEGIDKVHSIGTHVMGDAWLAAGADMAHDAHLAHFQSVPLLQHLATGVSSCRSQNGVLAPGACAGFVDQEDACVVEPEAIPHHVCGAV